MILSFIKNLKVNIDNSKNIKKLALHSNHKSKLKNDLECLEINISKISYLLRCYPDDKDNYFDYLIEFKQFNKLLVKCIKDLKYEKNFHN